MAIPFTVKCEETGQPADDRGTCPVHHGDACLKVFEDKSQPCDRSDPRAQPVTVCGYCGEPWAGHAVPDDTAHFEINSLREQRATLQAALDDIGCGQGEVESTNQRQAMRIRDLEIDIRFAASMLDRKDYPVTQRIEEAATILARAAPPKPKRERTRR